MVVVPVSMNHKEDTLQEEIHVLHTEGRLHRHQEGVSQSDRQMIKQFKEKIHLLLDQIIHCLDQDIEKIPCIMDQRNKSVQKQEDPNLKGFLLLDQGNSTDLPEIFLMDFLNRSQKIGFQEVTVQIKRSKRK